MKIFYILHASFEKLGAIETWAIKNKHELNGVHSYLYEPLPSNHDYDLLVIMGGPQSPFEQDKYSFLTEEILFIKEAIKKRKKMLGICLGAQLIAEALGAKTQKSPEKEVGIYPVELLESASAHPISSLFPKMFDTMHWHNDMPGIPDGATVLAKSKGCPQQLFVYGDRIYGFQCHLEMTDELIQGMIANCPNDLIPGKYINSEEALLKANFSVMNNLLFGFLDYIAALESCTVA